MNFNQTNTKCVMISTSLDSLYLSYQPIQIVGLMAVKRLTYIMTYRFNAWTKKYMCKQAYIQQRWSYLGHCKTCASIVKLKLVVFVVVCKKLKGFYFIS